MMVASDLVDSFAFQFFLVSKCGNSVYLCDVISCFGVFFYPSSSVNCIFRYFMGFPKSKRRETTATCEHITLCVHDI